MPLSVDCYLRMSLVRIVSATCCLIGTTCLAAQPGTTAWRDGSFHIERKGIVERSDVILQKPNLLPQQAMPLGNGRLGLAVWAENGYTAQLNRGDTFPLRLSPGQVNIPSLKRLTDAPDYGARLNVYNGEFEEHGGGMTATTYVAEALDVMIIDVTGADPKILQSAELTLWSPRQPKALVNGNSGALAETWLDDKEAGASGETFGSLAAITADGNDLHAEKTSALTVKITFHSHIDGSFRILVGSPTWRGGDALASASTLLVAAAKLSTEEHRTWWHHFWERPGLMKLSSADHAAEYLENLRTIDLFTAAAESRDKLPGSQAGIGDLFSSIRDSHKWGPSAYWHWNLRMQVSANLGAGLPELNDSYFALYRQNLPNILAWTKLHMAGRPGICVPETMRFNGRGYENETWITEAALNCAGDSKPYYNARTISTGAEVSLWVWQQYLFTGDRKFLAQNYPILRESAQFLLAYATHTPDGGLHTFPSNAHESKWDVHDPTTDISAMHALFPAVIEAATILKIDPGLAAELKKELAHLPVLPRINLASPNVLTVANDDSAGTVIAASYDPAAETHNSENLGLEPVWPYGLIGDGGPLHAIAVRTFMARPNKNDNDWSADPVQAARLGLTAEFKSSLLALTERYQTYPSGLASFMGSEFYVEQAGVLADALQTALVQDYDGLVRIAPAWPKDWDADATVAIEHNGRVNLQLRKGDIITLGIDAGSADAIRIRNPWPGMRVEIVDARTNHPVVSATDGPVIGLKPVVGHSYLVRRAVAEGQPLEFKAVSGTPAFLPKSLGSRAIGIR
ncbi:glycosyl hydrolase family 95 catalytic domain-containing protein [Granulicella arctica]|uniref:glycosyl hydrolase family 95 catalytic domain-containing protein n=1 Tax=Granulicella arctica TaxID=940613 RepID=UPI0021E0654C|nr:glycoside hydrolase [Granulicella arctica]